MGVTDVFFIHYLSDEPLRKIMAGLSAERWGMEDGIDFHLWADKSNNFHIEAKRIAEENSVSSIYVVADDDCLILGKDFVKRGVDRMKRYPKYGLIAASNICEGPHIHDSSGVIEMDMVGGVSFVRKGILTEFKSCTPPEVDTVICEEIRRQGFKTGIMPDLKFNHLGCGYSISSPGWWMQVPV